MVPPLLVIFLKFVASNKQQKNTPNNHNSPSYIPWYLLYPTMFLVESRLSWLTHNQTHYDSHLLCLNHNQNHYHNHLLGISHTTNTPDFPTFAKWTRPFLWHRMVPGLACGAESIREHATKGLRWARVAASQRWVTWESGGKNGWSAVGR